MDGISTEHCSVSAGRFSVADLTSVEEQIIELMKGGNGIRYSASNYGSSSKSDSEFKRVLRHGPTIVSLPSRQLPDKEPCRFSGSGWRGLSNPGAIFRQGTRKFLFDSYVLGYFNCRGHAAGEDHFFLTRG